MLDANIGLPQPGPYITYGYWLASYSCWACDVAVSGF